MNIKLPIVIAVMATATVLSQCHQGPPITAGSVEPAIAQETPTDSKAVRPPQDVARRNAFLGDALDSSERLNGNLTAARSRYWLEEAQRVEAATGQTSELFLLDKLAESNQRVKAAANGRLGLPVTDKAFQDLPGLLLESRAILVAFHRLYNGANPDGFPNSYQVEPGASLKAIADFNDDRRLTINSGDPNGKK